MKQFQAAQNPQLELQKLAADNPNVQIIFNALRANNLTLPQLAQMLAQQRGININDLIRELQS